MTDIGKIRLSITTHGNTVTFDKIDVVTMDDLRLLFREAALAIGYDAKTVNGSIGDLDGSLGDDDA